MKFRAERGEKIKKSQLSSSNTTFTDDDDDDDDDDDTNTLSSARRRSRPTDKKKRKRNDMFITKFLQMAVKKGPFARGGLKWKGHGAFKVTQTRKTNAKKRLKYVNENDSVLKEAAASDSKSMMSAEVGGGSSASASK